MSYNIDYAKSGIAPFGGMTKDMIRLFKEMKTEKFICVQTMDTKFGNSIFTLRGQQSDDEFGFGGENVMAVNRYQIPEDVKPIVTKAKNIVELAKEVDRAVVKKILEFGEDCEELPIDFKIGMSPCVRSAGLSISNKLMRLTRLAIVGNKKVVATLHATISNKLATIACDIDEVIVFNAGTMSFDGGVFFVPISLDKSDGYELTYYVVSDNAALNFVKLVESEDEAEPEWLADVEDHEAQTIFSQIDSKRV